MSHRNIILMAVALCCALPILALSGCPAPSGQTESVSTDTVPTAPAQTITQIGSTTVLPIAEKWQKAFNAVHPEIKIAVSGGGSGAGIKALIAKSCELANASRKIKDEEIKTAQAAGVTPHENIIAYDGIAVIVNPANKITELSLEQLSDIFSGKTKQWGDVGGDQGDIQLVNRESGSGTYDSFKEMVVTLDGKAKERDFAPEALSQTSNAGMLASVSQTKSAIGYVGLGYVNDSVKVLGVIPADGGQVVSPSAETVRDTSYPIARKLYIYTNGEPTGIIKEYFDWAFGPEGQKLVEEAGYIPIS